MSDLQWFLLHFEHLDTSLVMTSASEGLGPAQQGLVAKGAFESLVCAMDPGSDPEVHALGAELASYLSASNATNRAHIGLLPGVLPQLVQLVNFSVHYSDLDDVIVRGAENAAEAIAILSKANAKNNEILAQTTAAGDLAAMLERADGEMTPKGKMWAAAALGNMMSERDANLTSLAREVQQAMVDRRLMPTLVSLARAGSVQANDPVEEMPSTAARTNASRTYPHIYGWATMHAIENLALHEGGRAQLRDTSGARELLCALRLSPDPLETSKAGAIVAIASWVCGGSSNFKAHTPRGGKAEA